MRPMYAEAMASWFVPTNTVNPVASTPSASEKKARTCSISSWSAALCSSGMSPANTHVGGVDDATGTGVAVAVAVGVGVCVGVFVGVGVKVAVAVGAGVGVCVAVAVRVGVKVGLG